MLGDLLFSTGHESRKGFADAGGEPIDKGFVEFCPPFGLALSAPLSDFKIGETFFFSQLKRPLFDQKTLPLVSLAGPAPRSEERRVGKECRSRGSANEE